MVLSVTVFVVGCHRNEVPGADRVGLTELKVCFRIAKKLQIGNNN